MCCAIPSRLKGNEFYNTMKNNSSDCVRKIASVTDKEKIMLQKGFVENAPLSMQNCINIETLKLYFKLH